jgi:hypothetical protein
MFIWRRSWVFPIIVLIFLIYAIGFQVDEQFIESYGSWLPHRLKGDGSDYEDPILAVLNSTEAPFNITDDSFANGLFLSRWISFNKQFF